MDWKSAIAHLKNLEGAADSVSTLEAEINRLTNANFEVLKDQRNATTKLRDAETKLTDLLQLVGAEGEDLKAKATSANEKVKTLQADLTKLTKEKTEVETKYQTLETEATLLKRRTIIQEAAAKTGAVADVLTTLTKDLPVERIVIDNDVVAIAAEDGKDKKPLKEYAEATWAAFVPALFPSTTTSTNQRLPNGSPTSASPKDDSPLQTYRASTYDKTIEKMLNPAT